jgi:hypothetical protein
MGELKFLNVDTCKFLRTCEPRVNVNGKSGTLSINKEAAEVMKLTEESTIQGVLHDKWTYLLPNFKGGFNVRTSEKQKGGFQIQNSALARSIMKNHGFDEKSSYGFKVGQLEDLKGHEVYELKKQSVLE